MTRKKDPLWSVVKILPTDYAGYGGEVPEEKKAGDCSSGCRWAAYLEQSGDWLVCTKPRSPRFGLLTWEHQAGGDGCFEWACDRCLLSGDDCKCPPEADFEEQPTRCSFCGKGRREVAKLITSELPPRRTILMPKGGDVAPDSEKKLKSFLESLLPGPGWISPPDTPPPKRQACAICNECVGLCYDLIGGDTGPTSSHTLRPEQHAALVAWAKKLDDKRVAHQMQLEHSSPPRRVDQPYGAEGCICTETVVAKSECPVHGPPHQCFQVDLDDGAKMRVHGNPNMSADALEALKAIGSAAADCLKDPPAYICRPELCSLCGNVNAEGCDMCGGTGQTCATHARSWSLCKDERDKP